MGTKHWESQCWPAHSHVQISDTPDIDRRKKQRSKTLLHSLNAPIQTTNMEIPPKAARTYGDINDKSSDEEDFADTQNQNVSISVGSHGVRSEKAAVVCLIVLAVVLFTVDVSLGIYYSQQTDAMPQTSEGFQKILKNYQSTVESRNSAVRQLEKEKRQIEVTRWELEHQKRRGRDYNTILNMANQETAGLQTKVNLLTMDCGHCLPGWTYILSRCFYLSRTNQAKRSWTEARGVCKRMGADLAVVDSSVKQSTLHMHIQDRSDPSASLYGAAYWIGLRDVDEEGVWKWLNGKLLVDSFWHNGEPNDQGSSGEDCAGIYPGVNPFSAWNDVPCTHPLKWICEMDSQDL
ncbi:unnamed protein product [Arctogadus glacialis]